MPVRPAAVIILTLYFAIVIGSGSALFLINTDDSCKSCPRTTVPVQLRTITKEDLQAVLNRHRDWYEKTRATPDALEDPDPRKANLSHTDLTNRNLSGANLLFANLDGADLSGTDLSNADLTGASLVGADLEGTTLSNTDFSDADLACAIYEPLARTGIDGPAVGGLALAQNLCQLTYRDSPHGLMALRETLQKAGDEDSERAVTFAIRYEERLRSVGRFRENAPARSKGKAENDLASRMSSIFEYFAFELTCSFGLSAGRPLGLLALFVPLFSAVYFIALLDSSPERGIFRVWPKETIVAANAGKVEAISLTSGESVVITAGKAVFYSLFFSVVSAFGIGWHDLSVGNWIERWSADEYTLRALGWPRVVAGVQSVISGFLLALWVLCYFGRPFD